MMRIWLHASPRTANIRLHTLPSKRMARSGGLPLIACGVGLHNRMNPPIPTPRSLCLWTLANAYVQCGPTISVIGCLHPKNPQTTNNVFAIGGISSANCLWIMDSSMFTRLPFFASLHPNFKACLSSWNETFELPSPRKILELPVQFGSVARGCTQLQPRAISLSCGLRILFFSCLPFTKTRTL